MNLHAAPICTHPKIDRLALHGSVTVVQGRVRVLSLSIRAGDYQAVNYRAHERTETHRFVLYLLMRTNKRHQFPVIEIERRALVLRYLCKNIPLILTRCVILLLAFIHDIDIAPPIHP